MSRAPGSYAGLTVRQAELLSFIREQEAAGVTPSFEEMAAAIGLTSKGAVHRLVESLKERGYLTSLNGGARSTVTVERSHRPRLNDASIAQLIAELEQRGVLLRTDGRKIA